MKNQHEPNDQERIDYIRDSKIALNEQASKWAVLSIYLLIAVIVFAIAWAYFAKVEEVTVGEGKVIASSELQVVEHLEGGIVKVIKVDEGDKVKAGQVLVVLDNTRFQAEHKETLAKIAVYDAEIARLKAEVSDSDQLEFTPEFKKNFPLLAAQAVETFKSDKSALDGSIGILEKSQKLMRRELGIIKPLVHQGVMSHIDMIRLERQLNEIDGQILEKKEKFKTDAGSQLNKIKSERSVLLERLTSSKDRMDRTYVKSPVDGVVHQTYVSTVGEVVQAGSKILDIVPSDDRLTIQAYIKPADIGFIYPGQKAVIKVSAYDFSIYGGLDAKVKNISADAITDQSGASFYEVKLETDKIDLGKNGKKLEIISGMTVTVNIITGKKTVMDYIMKPILKARNTALRER